MSRLPCPPPGRQVRRCGRKGAVAIGATIVLTGIAGCSDGGPSPPVADRWPLKAIWGPVNLRDGRSAFPLYRELGVDVVQLQLRWERTAQRRPGSSRDPEDPAYDWGEEIDTAIERAARIDAEVALLITGSPPWASGGRSLVWAPRRARDLADFATAASRRYPAVRIWMVWGEPNRADRFRPAGDAAPGRYAELLDAAYGALHRADAGDVVVGGMTFAAGSPRPARFLRGLRLPDGRPPRLDWYGHNPYPYRLPRLATPPVEGGFRDLSDTDTLTREVAEHWRASGRHPPLWLSEFTVQTDRSSRIFELAVSRRTQAAWLRAGYRVAQRSGAVAGLGWFSLIDEQPEAPDSSHWGLMTTDLERKPSFRAYARVSPDRGRAP